MSTIVVLNGVSSAGKTTLARAFQEAAPSLFLNFSIDSILTTLPPSVLERLVRGGSVRTKELHAAFFACVRELAKLGHDLVIDNAIVSEFQSTRLMAAVAGHRVLFVLVTCGEDVLRERERARGDRREGMACEQLPQIEQWLQHDLRIDTATTSPEDGARQIVAALSR